MVCTVRIGPVSCGCHSIIWDCQKGYDSINKMLWFYCTWGLVVRLVIVLRNRAPSRKWVPLRTTICLQLVTVSKPNDWWQGAISTALPFSSLLLCAMDHRLRFRRLFVLRLPACDQLDAWEMEAWYCLDLMYVCTTMLYFGAFELDVVYADDDGDNNNKKRYMLW